MDTTRASHTLRANNCLEIVSDLPTCEGQKSYSGWERRVPKARRHARYVGPRHAPPRNFLKIHPVFLAFGAISSKNY